MDNMTRLYRVRKTCIEMLHDRDYVITTVSHACSSCLVQHPLALALGRVASARLGWEGTLTPTPCLLQEEREMAEDKDRFQEVHGEAPMRENLTIFVSKKASGSGCQRQSFRLNMCFWAQNACTHLCNGV